MSALPLSLCALRLRLRPGAAVLPTTGPRMAPDLDRAARAVGIAASDELAHAARTDHLASLVAGDANQGLHASADAVRQHAESLDEGARWLRRCAVLPRLPALVEALEQGAQVWADGAPLSAGVVVVRPDEDAADDASPAVRAWRAVQRGARRLAARVA